MGCVAGKKVHEKPNRLWFAVGAIVLIALAGAVDACGQVPADIEAGLVKIGHIVDPICTAKLYRPLMPPNDINSNVTPLYPGITIARDQSFGPDPKPEQWLQAFQPESLDARDDATCRRRERNGKSAALLGRS